MGLSNAATAAAAAALSQDHVPMFGAVTTADQFTGQAYPGLAQVAPDVTAQISLLAATIRHLGAAILVYDNTTADYYTADMRKDFETYFGSHLTGAENPYTPGLPDTNEDFTLIAPQVCYQQGPVTDHPLRGPVTRSAAGGMPTRRSPCAASCLGRSLASGPM
jgi:ABC-type branched-subunit amino acid transport system substrate-binding protein